LAISKDDSEEFLKDFKPDHKKLALFQIFLNDRILKLEDLSKRFLKSLMPNFLQEINYLKYELWSEEIKKNQEKAK
jgi:hypothetical protein